MTSAVDRRQPTLIFPSYDGTEQARVAHGRKCVIVVLEPASNRWAVATRGAIVLAPAEARALGRRLIQQAAASETTSG